MDFQLDQDQLMIQQTVRRFASEKLAPHSLDISRGTLDVVAQLDALAALGLRGARSSFDHGGSQMDRLSEALLLEEIARHDAGLALLLANHTLGALLLSQLDHARAADFATEGEAWITTALLQETPEHEETITLPALFGTSRCSHLLLCSPTCAWLIALDDAARAETEPHAALGLRTASPASLNVTLAPASCLEGWTSEHFTLASREAHSQLAAIAVGIGQGAYDVGARYAFDRKQFGRRLSDFQITQFKLADMATRQESARLMVHHLATRPEGAEDALRLALDTHAYAVRAATFIADESLQLHGGYGYTMEYPIERHYRDALSLSILLGGLHEVQRRAGALFLERA